MRVLVDARLFSGVHGGVEQAIIGLADAFSMTQNMDLQFCWLVYEGQSEWLSKHLPNKSELIEVDAPNQTHNKVGDLIEQLRHLSFFDFPIELTRKYGPFRFSLPEEPLIVQKINPTIIHFPKQIGFKTRIPNVYQPHDLQHLHFPEFFTREQRYLRKYIYGFMINQARRVVVGNEWTKADFIFNYQESKDKFDNVPLFPQLLPNHLDDKDNKLQFTKKRYFFYPATYWRHKNHELLLRAFAQVLDRGHKVDLVLSGSNLQGNKNIIAEINDLGIQENVHIVGFIETSDLATLYRNACGVIVPSLFESASFPIWEAFAFGVPVAASRITSIAQQVQNSALLFDPTSVNEITNSMLVILQDEIGNVDRVRSGQSRVRQFSAENSAIGFRYSYRRALELHLDELDCQWEKEKNIF